MRFISFRHGYRSIRQPVRRYFESVSVQALAWDRVEPLFFCGCRSVYSATSCASTLYNSYPIQGRVKGTTLISTCQCRCSIHLLWIWTVLPSSPLPLTDGMGTGPGPLQRQALSQTREEACGSDRGHGHDDHRKITKRIFNRSLFKAGFIIAMRPVWAKHARLYRDYCVYSVCPYIFPLIMRTV
ncbi:hypothetical protein BDW60DRAFT_97902 [Aspergillus nidulans var. acristatus]